MQVVLTDNVSRLQQEASKENKQQEGPEELLCIQGTEFHFEAEHLSFGWLGLVAMQVDNMVLKGFPYGSSLSYYFFLQIFIIIHIRSALIGS